MSEIIYAVNYLT